MTKQLSLICAALAMLAACAQTKVVKTAPTVAAAPVSFVVIGDIPYDAPQHVLLNNAVPQIKAQHPSFVIHVGDYKGGGHPCAAADDQAFQTLINSLDPLPVFYTPGDNEWVDCDRFKDPATGQKMSELMRLQMIRTAQFSKPPANVAAVSDFQQHSNVRENVGWSYAGMRFATIHMTGTNNGRNYVQGDPLASAETEAIKREKAALEWIEDQTRFAKTLGEGALVFSMHADPTDVENAVRNIACTTVRDDGVDFCDAFAQVRRAFVDAALEFGGPVLLIHGDTDGYTLNQEIFTDTAPNLWRLNAAGDAGIGSTGHPYGVEDVTVVTITLGAATPFSAVGLLTGKKPKS